MTTDSFLSLVAELWRSTPQLEKLFEYIIYLEERCGRLEWAIKVN